MVSRLSLSILSLLAVTAAWAAEPNIPPQSAAINELIAAKWKEADIKKPAARSTDFEFLRRVYIDVLGRVATPEEVLDFEADRSTDKRSKLIKRLLYTSDFAPKVNGSVVKVDAKTTLKFDYTEEYAEHWANIWTIWLMSRSVNKTYRDQMEIWLLTAITDNMNYKDMVTKILTATGKSDDNGAINFIGLQLGEKNVADRRMELGTFDTVPITSRVTRLFLGLQTQCTQCHDHPFNKEWVQSDFWGVNAFFRQVSRSADPTPNARLNNAQMMVPIQQYTLNDTSEINTEGRVFYERRDGQLKSIRPTFLKDIAQAEKGEKSDKFAANLSDTKTRREAMARYVVSHDNFSKAYVNRMWGHFFGRGLCKEPSVDDFGSHNEVVHPELLAKLGEEFAKYNYNPKQLTEWILNSDVYQLSHTANKDYIDPKYEPYFARMPLKAMSPETLHEAIWTATKADTATVVDKRARSEARDRWLSKLVAQFGDDEGNELVFNGTIVQALLMMNGREINAEIGPGGANAVKRVVDKHTKAGVANPSAIIDELFLMTLNRRPTAEEKTKLINLQQKGAIIKPEATSTGSTPAPMPPKTPAAAPPAKGSNPKKPPAPAKVPATPGIVLAVAPNDVAFYQDLFWALLNTNEFMINH
ncbi:MAG: DUF1549 domain-containing protein [Fimbriiglobus sp.]